MAGQALRVFDSRVAGFALLFYFWPILFERQFPHRLVGLAPGGTGVAP